LDKGIQEKAVWLFRLLLPVSLWWLFILPVPHPLSKPLLLLLQLSKGMPSSSAAKVFRHGFSTNN